MCNRLQLTEEEDVEIALGDEDTEVAQKKGDLCLIGKSWDD